jgi:NADP-dependent 3-hydroxy acid dehydrogenase YdfG
MRKTIAMISEHASPLADLGGEASGGQNVYIAHVAQNLARHRFPDIDVNVLQDPANVAETVRFVLSQPAETVIPEVMVIPMRESSRL